MQQLDVNTRPVDGFVDLYDVIVDLQVDLKYAGADNFTGAVLPGYQGDRACLSVEAAMALSRVQRKALRVGLGVLLFDAYRPQRAVDRFIDWAAQPDLPEQRRRYYPNIPKRELFQRGYLSQHSAHSRGSTVDLTLLDLHTGRALDMGTEFDLFDAASHTDFPGLNAAQQGNRKRLQDLMESAGFVNYWMEWWHFTLRGEPYPHSYFDFSIV